MGGGWGGGGVEFKHVLQGQHHIEYIGASLVNLMPGPLCSLGTEPAASGGSNK